MSEIEESVEKAIKYLRNQLSGAELQLYENYYQNYKNPTSTEVKYYNAYRILRKYIAIMEAKKE
jgi:hypothetical protein